MNRGRSAGFVAGMAVATCATMTQASTFSTMTIDGDFSDWAGVPVLDSDPLDNPGAVDIADVQLANDNDFLYVRMTYHDALSVSTYIAIDTDENVATGFDIFGQGLVGSEAGWQNDFPFDQRGGFNSGAINLGALIAPAAGVNASARELAIPRASLFVNDNAPVFPDDDFNLLLWTDNGFDVSGLVGYTFAVPEPSAVCLLAGGLALVSRRRYRG